MKSKFLSKKVRCVFAIICAAEVPRWSISWCCFHLNAVPTGTASTCTSPSFSVQKRVNLMLRWHIFFFPFSPLLLKIMAWIIWIVAAPGVISQGCSPLGGALTRKMGSWFSRELLALRQGESQGWRVRTGGHLRTGAQAESPGTSVTQVSVFGQGWLCAQGHPVLVRGRMEQPSTLGAVFCPYCWLVTWDLIPAPFDISFPKEILLFSLLLFIYIYFFVLLALILLAITAVPGSYLWLL